MNLFTVNGLNFRVARQRYRTTAQGCYVVLYCMELEPTRLRPLLDRQSDALIVSQSHCQPITSETGSQHNPVRLFVQSNLIKL